MTLSMCSCFYNGILHQGAAEGSEKRGCTEGECRRRWVTSAEGQRIEALTECPLPSRLRGLGERRELPQWGPGRRPGRKRILDIFLAHRTRLAVRKMRWTVEKLIGYYINLAKFWGGTLHAYRAFRSKILRRHEPPCLIGIAAYVLHIVWHANKCKIRYSVRLIISVWKFRTELLLVIS